jgi:hypothetical protein
LAVAIGFSVVCLAVESASAQMHSFESVNFPGRFIRHFCFQGELTAISSALDRSDATFALRPAPSGTPGVVSFVSVNYLGLYLRYQFWRLKLHPNDGSALFRQDACFNPKRGLSSRTGI